MGNLKHSQTFGTNFALCKALLREWEGKPQTEKIFAYHLSVNEVVSRI